MRRGERTEMTCYATPQTRAFLKDRRVEKKKQQRGAANRRGIIPLMSCAAALSGDRQNERSRTSAITKQSTKHILKSKIYRKQDIGWKKGTKRYSSREDLKLSYINPMRLSHHLAKSVVGLLGLGCRKWLWEIERERDNESLRLCCRFLQKTSFNLNEIWKQGYERSEKATYNRPSETPGSASRVCLGAIVRVLALADASWCGVFFAIKKKKITKIIWRSAFASYQFHVLSWGRGEEHALS